MTCELCTKNPATVQVTELAGHDTPDLQVRDRHLCEACARSLALPSAPVVTAKGVIDIWKLLRQSAQRARASGGLACPACGMTLAEFRSKGRFGCPKDYEVFRKHIEPLLLRVHNAREHQGRLPGMDHEELQRRQQLTDLRTRLEAAIRDEAYESAAQLRDEIQELEAHRTP